MTKNEPVLAKPTRSQLANELKQFKVNRNDKLGGDYQLLRNTYDKAYTEVKKKVLTDLGYFEHVEAIKNIVGGANYRWNDPYIEKSGSAYTAIAVALTAMGIVQPPELPEWYSNGHERYYGQVQIDYENARKHIMYDEPMTVTVALGIIEDFRQGRPIAPFVPSNTGIKRH